jgi:hypothetical protein
VQAVAPGPEHILSDFAEAENAEDQARDGDPQKGSPGPPLGWFLLGPVHRAHMRA